MKINKAIRKLRNYGFEVIKLGHNSYHVSHYSYENTISIRELLKLSRDEKSEWKCDLKRFFHRKNRNLTKRRIIKQEWDKIPKINPPDIGRSFDDYY